MAYDDEIKKYLELKQGLSPEQDVEELRRQQTMASQDKADASRYGGIMNIARGLTFNTKNVDSPEAWVERQQKIAGQSPQDVLDRQKAERTTADAVREHLLGGLKLKSDEKQHDEDLRLKKTAQTLDEMKAIGDISHKKEEERLSQEKIDVDRLAAEHKATQEKQPSQSQSAAASYAVRAQEANKNLDALAEKGYDRTSTGERLNNWLPNEFVDENRQLQDQGEANFINATLRRDSGASISKDEYAKAERQYFPRPGDTQAVVEQKRRNREIVTAALAAEGGPAMAKIAAVDNANGMPSTAVHASSSIGKSGLTPAQRKARIAELKSKLGQ